MRVGLMIAALLALLAAPAGAQDVRTLVFTASTDHNATLNGTPILSSYQADVLVGTPTGALAFTQGLGKPTPATPVPPATAGDISIDMSQFPSFVSLARGAYVVVVSAVGPGGTSRSLPSDPFLRFGTPVQPGKPRIQ